MATLNRKGVLKSGAGVYQLEGAQGTVVIGPQLLADGAAFGETIEVSGFEFTAPKAKPAKMTKEERAAARAAMTPEQKLAESEARLAKQKENLEKRKAALKATA